MAFLLLSAAKTRPLSMSTSVGQQADGSQTPFSPESSVIDDDCNGLDGEECLVKRQSLQAVASRFYPETGYRLSDEYP
ncbi:hypothetical protein V6N12_059899 [Hibiscus sabdariffa]|uniref:Phytosulfokine-beta n=1 Tax=Hibiscus sabdariffa TaxID=183260 RepID=A0ABR2D2W4_9ROSI